MLLLDTMVQENLLFLRCLNLLEKPSSGQIIFEGIDIAAENADIDTS